MPADVAHEREDRAVGALDDVVEVAAEHAVAARAVADPHLEALVDHGRRGQQRPLEPVDLLGAHEAAVQGAVGVLEAAALDGVAHRAAEQLAVDLALDEVVLGAGRDGREPDVGAGQAR